MKDCPACLHKNADDAATCESCGYEFDSTLEWKKTSIPEVEITDFSTGDMIANRYHVERELGRGGMGVVYLVRDTKLRDREMGLKMIHPNLIDHPETKQLFEDEVLICLDLLHSNIVRVYNLEEWGDRLFFTMEYVPGRSLRQWLTERKKHNPPFSLPEVISVIDPLLEALSYAHQSIIHRDIKPENILISGEFPDVHIKVMDFGIAMSASPTELTHRAHAMGTAYFMSPEQMAGASDIDQRADLYSVGMILYEMLTGDMAIGRFSLPGELVDDLPPELDNVVDKALAPKPEGRFNNAEQMGEALGKVVPIYEKRLKDGRQAEIEDLFNKGKYAFANRQWPEAERNFSNVLELNDSHEQAKSLLKEAKEKNNELDDLLKKASEAENRDDFKLTISMLEKAAPLSSDKEQLEQRISLLEQKLDKKKLEEARQQAEAERQQEDQRKREEQERLEAEKRRHTEEEQRRLKKEKTHAEGLARQKAMNNEETKSQADIEWEQRTLCIDESCIGVIGPDGRCKECGLAFNGEQLEEIQEEQTVVGGEDAEETIENQEAKTQADREWEQRTLCADESCIGVIGPDGFCKECGFDRTQCRR